MSKIPVTKLSGFRLLTPEQKNVAGYYGNLKTDTAEPLKKKARRKVKAVVGEMTSDSSGTSLIDDSPEGAQGFADAAKAAKEVVLDGASAVKEAAKGTASMAREVIKDTAVAAKEAVKDAALAAKQVVKNKVKSADQMEI